MTLRQLEYLIAVAQAGSFAAAATKIGVSQPTLSQQIRALEDEVGAPLLSRTSRGVVLTPAGRAFVPDANAALSSARRAMANGRRAGTAAPETLRVAAVRSLVVAVLPAVVKRWIETYPGVSIHIRECEHRRQVAEMVLADKVDLGIGPLPEAWKGAHVELGWEQLAVVLPSGDPLLHAGSRIGLDALAQRDWVLMDERNGILEPLLRACRSVGFDPTPAVRTEQIEAASRLAAAGIGPALVPINNIPEDLAGNVKMTDPPIAWKVWA
ncbi:MAG: LysR family transcriptional regulator, partial [Jatrophihabitans sp.]